MGNHLNMHTQNKTAHSLSALGLSFMFMLSGCGGNANIAQSKPLGEVDTETKLFGSNHKVVVEVFEDPQVEGIAAFVSKAKKGGISGDLGFAEETSDASIAVRQTGPIKVKKGFDANKQEVFSESRSLLFKNLHVTRFWDKNHKAFVYLVHSDKFIEGSPKNSISAVIAESWEGQRPDLTLVPAP